MRKKPAIGGVLRDHIFGTLRRHLVWGLFVPDVSGGGVHSVPEFQRVGKIGVRASGDLEAFQDKLDYKGTGTVVFPSNLDK